MIIALDFMSLAVVPGYYHLLFKDKSYFEHMLVYM
jgi:hypothetical protein